MIKYISASSGKRGMCAHAVQLQKKRQSEGIVFQVCFFHGKEVQHSFTIGVVQDRGSWIYFHLLKIAALVDLKQAVAFRNELAGK